MPKPTFADVIEAVSSGEVDLGFLPIENSIEGTVSATLDSLVFEVDLLIQREVVLDVHLNLVAPPGTQIAAIRRVLSYPACLGPVPAIPLREAADGRGRRHELDGGGGEDRGRGTSSPRGRPRAAGSRPSCTGSRYS